MCKRVGEESSHEGLPMTTEDVRAQVSYDFQQYYSGDVFSELRSFLPQVLCLVSRQANST